MERLNAAQPPALIGLATKLAGLAREQSAGRLRLRLPAVTSISEMLTAEDREAISAAFGVPVRQTHCGADITVVAGAGLDDAALAAAAERSLRQAGVTGPHVTISHAEPIARDPRTAKTRRFVAAGAAR